MLRIINSLHISAHFPISILAHHSHGCMLIVNRIDCELKSLYKFHTNWTLNQIYLLFDEWPIKRNPKRVVALFSFITYTMHNKRYNARMLIVVGDCLSMDPMMDQIKINIWLNGTIFQKFLKYNKLPRSAECSMFSL